MVRTFRVVGKSFAVVRRLLRIRIAEHNHQSRHRYILSSRTVMGCNNCGLIRSTATKRLEGHCLGKSLSQHTSVGERCSETYQTTSLARQMGFVASRCR